LKCGFRFLEPLPTREALMTQATNPLARSVLRIAVFGAFLAMASAPARSEQIGAVLERTQAARLVSLQAEATQGDRADIVRRSFETLVKRLHRHDDLEICVVRGPVVAELVGRVVVANESLADLPEPMRLFVLAHEMGHSVLRHRERMADLYAQQLPGELDATKVAVASDELVLAAGQLSRAHEFDADAFAYQLLHQLGYGFADVVGALTAFGMKHDTATHPGTGKRIAHLRSLG
jgi:hypothetical protein